VLICAGAVVVFCHQTLYRPVLTRMGVMSAIDQARGFRESEALLLSAAEADPFSVKPWLNLSGVYFYAWHQQYRDIAAMEQTTKNWKQFELAADRIRQLAPRSSQRHVEIANLHLMAYQLSRDPDKLNSALEWYQAGSSLYPNDALLHAQLAWTWDLAGDESEAMRAAERASQLDRMNPHSELKLKNRTVYTGSPANSQKNAEQVLVDLRKREMDQPH